MTIRIFKAVLAGSAMLALGLSANVAQAATGTANAKASILAAITVTKTADLDFGTIVTGAAGGAVTLTNAGAFTCAAALTCAGTPIVGGFNVGGTSGQFVSIAIANTSLNGPTGSTPMAAALTTSITSLKLTGNLTNDIFKVGGVLTVNTNQTEGVYSGAFTVTVNYQ